MRGRASLKICVLCGLSLLCGVIVVISHAQQDNFFSEWRPNANTRGIRYAGNNACVECHKEQAQQLHTPMAQALEVAPDCRIVTAKGKLTFRNGPYTYTIAREGNAVLYSIADGRSSITKPLDAPVTIINLFPNSFSSKVLRNHLKLIS